MGTPTAPTGMTRTMTFLFALAGATAVGNLYWAQPLLAEIARDLGVSTASGGTLVTATQLGYAVGVLVLVPLGDALDRRRFVPVMMGLSVVALLISALAPGYGALVGALAAVGITTISGQLLVPLAGDMSRDDQRGSVIGTIASGMLVGIMLSRFLSGVVADALGWRAVYVAAASVSLVFTVILARRLPADRDRRAVPYGRRLRSIGQAVAGSRPTQVTLAIGACAFVVFMLFWSGLTFLLSAPPFSYAPSQIGLVNLFGLGGVLIAGRAGLFHDRGMSTNGLGGALVLALLAAGVGYLGASSIVLIVVAIVLMNSAIQAINVLNQTRLLTIRPDLRSGMNTAFVFFSFIAAALGSALAGVLFELGGWTLLTMAQAGFVLLALTIWALHRSSLRSVEARSATA